MMALWDPLLLFMGRGGPVLWVIAGLLLVMLSLILERISFLFWGYQRQRHVLLQRWQARLDRTSWRAKAIRARWLAQAALALQRHLLFIRTLIVLCPMLGLLGTVTGMIGVFDTLAVASRFNPESMAGGISRATIPTMAGMVVALIGVLLLSRLESQARRLLEQTRDGMTAE